MRYKEIRTIVRNFLKREEIVGNVSKFYETSQSEKTTSQTEIFSHINN